MIGYYNYTVITTYLGLAFGVLGITFTLNGSLKSALICLMVAGFCDMIDGAIAGLDENRSDEAKAFGIQIDSLCDIVCFGVFPALICYTQSVDNANGAIKYFGIFAMYLYILTQVIRLGFFNVQEQIRQQQTSERRKNYTGLPVTSAAIIVPAVLLVAHLLNASFALVLDIMLLILSVLFVSRIPIKKPANRGKCFLSVIGLVIILGYIFCW